jgi:16S rRNA (uracil1498-N3)-methyltransferase
LTTTTLLFNHMALPRFFVDKLSVDDKRVIFDEASARHIVQVLRMEAGEEMLVTNGQGILLTAVLDQAGKKTAEARVHSAEIIAARPVRTCIAISLIKNSSRFEWFLEKAGELGISEIIPLICERTERQHFRADRLRMIMQSAMLQSQQSWITELQDPVNFTEVLKRPFNIRLVAHCEEGKKSFTISEVDKTTDTIILIGPEGDFTPAEISAAKAAGFQDLSLGSTRLRTETAGVISAAFLRI